MRLGLLVVPIFLLTSKLCFARRLSKKKGRRRSGAAGGTSSSSLQSPRQKQQANICPRDSRLFIAVKCNDAKELLYCPPMRMSNYNKQVPEDRPSVCGATITSASDGGDGIGPLGEWATQVTCQDNGGFQEILSYNTGCYPKDVSFWSSFAPELGIQNAGQLFRKVAGYPLPPLNVANSDFEDPEIGISEWSTVILGPEVAVTQKNDNFPRCVNTGMCLAYNGTGYALVSAGDTMDGATPPNSLSRSDFRIPAVDTNVCQPEVKFCFSFAMRFISKEVDLPPSETGNNDIFTVQIQFGEQGDMLYDRSIRSTDVEGFGDDTGWNGLGDDGGWELVEVELPSASLGEEPTFFTFRATSTNVNDYALDSVGYIDSLNIAPCGEGIIVV